MTLGNLIKILRGSESLRSLEERSGLSNAYLSQIENEKIKDISISTLKSLIKAFPNHRELILETIGL